MAEGGSGLHSEHDRYKLRSIVPALAGRYHFTFSIPGELERSFYARRHAGPTRAWNCTCVNTLHLLHSVLVDESGPVADILRAANTTTEQVRAACRKWW
ncbi:MAG: Clp protease N-terminal domain-containing protein [Longimicrobiales bacterium]